MNVDEEKKSASGAEQISIRDLPSEIPLSCIIHSRALIAAAIEQWARCHGSLDALTIELEERAGVVGEEVGTIHLRCRERLATARGIPSGLVPVFVGYDDGIGSVWLMREMALVDRDGAIVENASTEWRRFVARSSATDRDVPDLGTGLGLDERNEEAV